jgi:hypothetical protein
MEGMDDLRVTHPLSPVPTCISIETVTTCNSEDEEGYYSPVSTMMTGDMEATPRRTNSGSAGKHGIFSRGNSIIEDKGDMVIMGKGSLPANSSLFKASCSMEGKQNAPVVSRAA